MVYWLLSSFVSATLEMLIEKLADIGKEVHESISNVDEKLGKLKRTLLNVQSLIQVAEEKQINDIGWLSLLGGLEEAVYDADDLLDETAIGVSKLDGGKHKDVVRKLLSSLFKRIKALDLNTIQDRLDDMLKYSDSLCWRELIKGRQHLDMIVSKLQTSSLTDESHVFGRTWDKSILIDIVSAGSSRGSTVSIIPILGVMGVGKTVLAQLIYNHNYQTMMAHPFDLKMWVSVNRDFDVMRLTRSIIEAASGASTSHLLNLDTLQIKLIELLKGKKFLLVLDDLWNEKHNEWNLLLKPLKHGLSSSTIIVTTGSHHVSKSLGTTKSHHLECLSDEDCWLLLKDEALGDINLDVTPKLEAIGKEIARKCKGLPLAAKIFGSLLHTKDEDEWSSILKSEIWELSAIRDEIVPALRLNYYLLPLHVRHCFAYCCMFPLSYVFEKEKIVRMWMGEGFIIPDKRRRMIEDVGNDYFDQLLSKSFFYMEGEKCKMHDALHNLAQSVSGEKFLRMEKTNDSRIDKNTRHLSLVCGTAQQVTFEASDRCKRLRTLLLVCAKTPIKEVPFALAELGSLRVLDLSGTHIEELTWSIGNLKHLRFLDLSNTYLRWLPETTQELCILQTLRLVNCLNLLYLPRSFCRLKSLRHLELGGNSQLASMPSGIGKLTSLHTLSEFIVGSESGQLKELKEMNNIQGSLCLKQLEKVSHPEEAEDANLANKKLLNKLELQWTYSVDAHNDEHILDKLMISPHESLKELTLKRYGGKIFPAWVSNQSFSKLTSICFIECKNCLLFPPLGQLPKLKSLKIIGMDELVEAEELFVFDGPRFTALEILEFRGMNKLELWGGVREIDMVRLGELTVIDCPKLSSIPSLHDFRYLTKLELESCPILPSFTVEKLSNSMQSLIITDCEMLEERCGKDKGEDWTKIEHVPDIEINFVKIEHVPRMSLQRVHAGLHKMGTP